MSKKEKFENISNWVSDSHLLTYFFKEGSSLFKRILSFIFLFFVIPVALLVISALDKTLNFPGKPVGMLEDYLILSFAFGAAPLLFFFLRLVISRFIDFIRDIPNFTRISAEEYQALKKNAHDLIVGLGKSKKIIVIKYVVGVIALSSNMSSIIKRSDGWNSFAQPIQLSVTFVFLVIMLCFVLNNVLFKYLLILWAEIKITRQLAKEDLIVVRPIAPDKSGGLRNLGELSLAFTYFLLPFTLTGLTHYFTWRQLTVGGVLGLAGFIPLFVIVFFVPLGVVHRSMAEAKKETLNYLSEKYLQISRKVIKEIKSNTSDEELVMNKELVEMLDNMYEKAGKMPVWPFNLKTMSRFISITVGPVAIILLESFIQSILKKFI